MYDCPNVPKITQLLNSGLPVDWWRCLTFALSAICFSIRAGMSAWSLDCTIDISFQNLIIICYFWDPNFCINIAKGTNDPVVFDKINSTKNHATSSQDSTLTHHTKTPHVTVIRGERSDSLIDQNENLFPQSFWIYISSLEGQFIQ